MEQSLLRFILWAQNDACHVQQLLQQAKFIEHSNFSNGVTHELVFLRLNLPLFVLAKAIAKNVLIGRSIFQSKIDSVFPTYAIEVVFTFHTNLFNTFLIYMHYS